ncbi:MAG: caspase family protein, partial [Bacteroidota bacterium]
MIDEVRLSYDTDKLKAKQLAAAGTPDGRFLAFYHSDKKVRIFDTMLQRYRTTFSADFEKIQDLQVTTNGLVTIIAGNDLHIYEWNTGRKIKTVPLPGVTAKSQYIPATNQLFLGQSGKVIIIDLAKMEEVATVKFGGLGMGSMAVNPTGTRIAACTSAGPISLFKVMDVKTGQALISEKKMLPVFSLAYGEDGRLLTVEMGKQSGGLRFPAPTSAPGMLYKLYDPAGKEINAFTVPIAGRSMNAFECLLDGNNACFANPDFSIDIVNLDSRQHSYLSKADKAAVANYSVSNRMNMRIIPIQGGKILFSFSDTNLIRIYDTTTSQVTGYFFTDGGNGFCTVSRDGRMDGDMETLNNVFWTSRNSSKRTTLERTFERGYTPKLFNLLVNGTAEQAGKDFDIDQEAGALASTTINSLDGKPITSGAKIRTASKKVKLGIRVQGGKSGKPQLKISHNGKVVRTLPVGDGADYETELSMTTSFGSANYIAAYTEDNGIASEKSKLIIEFTGASDEQPKLYLVTIGINQYRNTKYNLNYAQADADGIASAVTGLPKGLFSTVVSHAIRNDKAIKANILQTFREIKASAKEQDMLVVYYAGHG